MADEETDQFSLRWNNFHSNLTDGFHALLQGEDLVDVTLAAGGKFVQAHKLVLSVCSPYFKDLFKVNPCKHPIVILKDVLYKDMVAILQFMYKGEVNVRQEELPAFLKTAETLQIKGLTGDGSSESDQNESSVQSPSPHVPHRVKDKPYNRHSAPVPSRHIAPNPQSFRPAKRTRLEVPSTSTLTPISPPIARETVPPVPINYVEMHTPKSEPVDDYESDIELLTSKSVDMIQLLSGDASQSHHEDTDSHQSHYDTTLPKLDSIQSLATTGNQTPMDTTLPQLDNAPHGSGMFSEISGTSHAQDGSQDGTQVGGVEYSTCYYCGKTMRKSSLRRHIVDRHGPEQNLACGLCFKVFRSANSLQTHTSIFHKNVGI